MDKLSLKSTKNQYLISFLLATAVSFSCLIVSDVLDYSIGGYLLLVVSLIAIFLEIRPVLSGAVLRALSSNIQGSFHLPNSALDANSK